MVKEQEQAEAEEAVQQAAVKAAEDRVTKVEAKTAPEEPDAEAAA